MKNQMDIEAEVINASNYNLSAGFQPGMPDIITLDDPLEERERLKILQVLCLRLFSKFGYDTDIAGHFAVKDPVEPDSIWVNPMLVPLALITPSDLVRIRKDGFIIEGSGPVNLGAHVIHSRLHQASSDVKASVHFHSPAGKAWSSTGLLLDPLNQDACAFYEDHVVFDVYRGVPQNTYEGDEIAAAMGGKRAAILRNHGLLTTAATLEGAAWRFVALERACECQLRLLGAPKVDLIPHDVAKATHDYVASEYSAWLSMQPMLLQARTEWGSFGSQANR